jgi:hypothetical protein
MLGRILYYVPYHSPIHPGRVVSTFAILSVLVETLTGNGVNFSFSKVESDSRAGHIILKVALLVQVMVELCFILLAVTFHRRCHRAGIRDKKLTAPLVTLYISTAFIMARTLYRTVEYFLIPIDLNYYDPSFRFTKMPVVITEEWYFYVFEATLMLLNVVLFNWRHPRRWLPENNRIYLCRDGKTEKVGPKWKDPRSFWLTVVDPMDFAGMIKGRRPLGFREFWDDDGTAAVVRDDKNKGEPQV